MDSNIYKNQDIPIFLANRRLEQLKESIFKFFQFLENKSDRSDNLIGRHNKKELIGKRISLVANDNKLKNVQGINLINYHLVQAKLHNNQLDSLKGIEDLQFPILQQLYLQYNRIQEIIQLGKSFFPNLCRLSLNNNRLRQRQCSQIIRLKAPQLRVLALQNNQLGCIDFLQNLNLMKLIDLNLSNNRISIVKNIGDWPFLQNLSKLELGGNRITSFCLIQLEMKNLRKLSINNNILTSAEFLSSSSFPNLNTLQLQHNFISCFRFIQIVHMPKLVDLRLHNNKFTSMPIKQLQYGLLPNLDQIHLKNNQIVGNISHLILAFTNAEEQREAFYSQIQNKTGSIGQLRKRELLQKQYYIRIEQNSRNAQNMRGGQFRNRRVEKIETYNDNKTITVISCWKNKLIGSRNANVYLTIKKHFPKLSFLQF